MLPKVMQGLNAFVDGDEFIGVATKVEPSLPKPKNKEINSPGHAGAIDVPTHKWEKSTPKLTLQDYPPQVIALVGDTDALDKPLTLIGVIGADDQRVIEIEVTGLWTAAEPSEWADDADAELAVTVSARTYKLTIDGKEVLFIDYERNDVRINGKNKTNALNKALRRGRA
ncbi:Uncharacterised protein [BD1-7 clade bacterium]|uniref:Phage tail tube protein FII n=1 Tax=BD1-7 clade bacterium TaxID=2029982 RepID=A0A5S9QVA0_9GAMM|nr:Uncharacterised protein [BD1-7 clade bacterium]CAA0122822.1 Uncharacterised protein [BD1-7 clade bacterium]